MKILITGIGCIGKSTLRERLALDFPDKVITVDMDYDNNIPPDRDKMVIVESVHGLDENPALFDRILYLLPPKLHFLLWLRRGWAWFSTGIVDLSAPKGKRKRFAASNIPIILKILIRNIFLKKRWIRADMTQIEKNLKGKTYITLSNEKGYRIIRDWIVNQVNLSDNHLEMEVT